MRLPSRGDGNATVLMYNNRAVSYALYRPDAGLPPADLRRHRRRHVRVEEELLELRVVLDDLIPRVYNLEDLLGSPLPPSRAKSPRRCCAFGRFLTPPPTLECQKVGPDERGAQNSSPCTSRATPGLVGPFRCVVVLFTTRGPSIPGYPSLTVGFHDPTELQKGGIDIPP
jgi:hypothetical protein